MGKSTPKPPPAPDPFEVASADAQFNRINQQTPFGSLNFFNPGQEPRGQQPVGTVAGGLTDTAKSLGATGLPTPGTSPPVTAQNPGGNPFGAFRGAGPNQLVNGAATASPTKGSAGQIPGFPQGGSNASASAVLNLAPELQFLENLRLTSDTNLAADALGRQAGLDPNPIDLSQFGGIQSNLDLPNVQAPNLQQATPGGVPQLDLQNQVAGLNTQGLNPLPGDATGVRNSVQDALFERATGLLNPEFERQERSLRQRLATQGLPTTGEAGTDELTRFERNRNEALNNAALDAIIRGGGEASRTIGDDLAIRGQGFGERQSQFGAGLQQAGFGNQAALQEFGGAFDSRNAGIEDVLRQNDVASQQFGINNALGQQGLQNQLTGLNVNNAARSQALNEQLGIRGNQFNELASLLGLQQVQSPTLQNFFQPGQVDTTGAFGLAQNAELARFQAEQQRNSAGLGGLFSLGSSALLGPLSGIFNRGS